MDFIKTHSLPLLLLIIAILFSLLSTENATLLRYEYSAISDGEIWRIFSGHLIHYSLTHLLLNLSALIVIWIIVHQFLDTKRWWYLFFISAFGISASLYLFMSDLQWYVGLSGVLHSIVTVGSIAAVLQGRKEFIILLVMIGFKLTFEQLYIPVTSEIFTLEGDVIVNAHFYGVLMGIISALIFKNKFIKI